MIHNSYFAHYRMDTAGGLSSDQRLFGLNMMGQDAYLVSAAIVNPSQWAGGDFLSSIMEITKKNNTSVEFRRHTNDFLDAYSSGARKVAQEKAGSDKIVERVQVVNRLTMRAKTILGGVSPIEQCRFKKDKKADFCFDALKGPLDQCVPRKETGLLKVGSHFLQTIATGSQNPILYSSVSPNFQGQFLGDALNTVTEVGLRVFTETRPYLPFLISVTSYHQNVPAIYMTSKTYRETRPKGKATVPFTNPLSDPAAIYNLLQMASYIDDEGIRSETNAQRAAAFLNEQVKSFSLRSPKTHSFASVQTPQPGV